MDAVFRARASPFPRARRALEILCDQNVIQPLSETLLFASQFPLLIKYSLRYKVFPLSFWTQFIPFKSYHK